MYPVAFPKVMYDLIVGQTRCVLHGLPVSLA